MSTNNKAMFVKPVDDALVRDPERGNQYLPEDGRYVPRNAYWLRRLDDGSATETKPPKEQKPANKSEDK